MAYADDLLELARHLANLDAGSARQASLRRAVSTAYYALFHLLELKGTHPELGLVTARQLMATWTAHDLGHLLQISRVMAKRYKQEVGRWAAYLSVMK